jgi:transposase-like protein
MLAKIQTVDEMIAAFGDERQCRRLLEALVWPNGRICPACGYKKTIPIAGRDMERRRARPGLYQCSSGECRFQFTATTHTPLHSTKLPLNTWFKALWLMLQSDKGMSSVRLAEALGVSQPTAWRMGHALRLMVAREAPLTGTVEIDEFYLGGRLKRSPDAPPPGRGRKGQRRTTKSPVLAMVQRPESTAIGASAADARASVVEDLSFAQTERVLEVDVDPQAHLMSDDWTTFKAVGQGFAAHETVQHSKQEYARGSVHANSVEGFNSRVRRTIAGVFHHISPQNADLYFHAIGFRWSQRIVTGQAIRRSRKGREKVRVLWARIWPALQLPQVFCAAIGRQMRRAKNGGLTIKSTVAVFG